MPVQIHPFRMMKTEVTVRQFWSCLSRGICQTYHLHGGGDQFFNNIAAGLPPTQWTEEEFLKDQDPVSHVLYDGELFRARENAPSFQYIHWADVAFISLNVRYIFVDIF